MPKSSKATGTEITSDMKMLIHEEIEKRINKIKTNLEKNRGLSRLRFLIIKKIEIERTVTLALPFASYQLKSDIISQFNDDYYEFDQSISFLSFTKKVAETLDTFPYTKKETVKSFIQKHRYYLPEEFITLMKVKQKIDISDATFEEVSEAIDGLIRLDGILEELIHIECANLKIDNKTLTTEKFNYAPKLLWNGHYSHFSGFMLSMIEKDWIDDPGKNLDDSADHFKYHFEIISGKHEVIKRTLSKSMGDFKRDVLKIDESKQKKLDDTKFPFTPLKIPNKI